MTTEDVTEGLSYNTTKEVGMIENDSESADSGNGKKEVSTTVLAAALVSVLVLGACACGFVFKKRV